MLVLRSCSREKNRPSKMTSILKEFSAKLRIKEKTPVDTCVEEILDKEEEPYEKVS